MSALKLGDWILRATDFSNYEEYSCLVICVCPCNEIILAIPKYRPSRPSWEYILFGQFQNLEWLPLPTVVKKQFSPYRASIGYYPHRIIPAPFEI